MQQHKPWNMGYLERYRVIIVNILPRWTFDLTSNHTLKSLNVYVVSLPTWALLHIQLSVAVLTYSTYREICTCILPWTRVVVVSILGCSDKIVSTYVDKTASKLKKHEYLNFRVAVSTGIVSFLGSVRVLVASGLFSAPGPLFTPFWTIRMQFSIFMLWNPGLTLRWKVQNYIAQNFNMNGNCNFEMAERSI